MEEKGLEFLNDRHNPCRDIWQKFINDEITSDELEKLCREKSLSMLDRIKPTDFGTNDEDRKIIAIKEHNMGKVWWLKGCENYCQTPEEKTFLLHKIEEFEFLIKEANKILKERYERKKKKKSIFGEGGEDD